jgi:hypothetical protein
MSLETNVGRALFDLADVLQTRVTASLATYRNENNVSWSDDELKALAHHIGGNLQGAITGGLDTILRMIRADGQN